ncbi:hypothetical protein FQN55_007168 [Onygenales sp. PD_40]|nr:hypothetical protein FQN55_007168 [Onygenales sp. PD_40]KAK2780789.1 hypothetical protein FQN52_002050 [Onygenales sp. PD_12]
MHRAQGEMEDFPPSYELATARDAWAIVAHYTQSADLCAASLVCRRWHEIFVPFLWGAPASHFGSEADNDTVYVALTRFRRTLRKARLEVRMLTHTFHLPPALSEIYGGPRPSWLQEVLDYLPNLQSLLVSQLPFFDHNSLVALRPKPNEADPGTAAAATSTTTGYGLRLLLAQREPNTTSIGIREALLRFPRLVYLDLSFTTPARDRGVLSAIARLEHLQVLKLRGIGLRDADLEILAESIKTRVRSLDVRNNMLTDASLRTLMQHCFLPPEIDVPTPIRDVKFHYEWSRTVSPFSGILSADSLKSEEFDAHFMKQLMMPLTGRSSPEDLAHVGITHLYVADNNLSVEGLGSLLNSTRLHVLDGGTVKTAESMWKRRGFEPIVDNESCWVVGVRFPGAEKLIPVLRHAAAENLTSLRVHHALVTEDAPQDAIMSPARRMPKSRPATRSSGSGSGSARLQPPHSARELDGSTSQIYELPAETEPVYELADTSTYLVGQAADEANARALRSITLNGASYPIDPAEPSPSSIPRFPTPDYSLPEAIRRPSISSPTPSTELRATLIQDLLSQRPTSTNPPYFHPSHTPHLRTLILTDIPATAPSSSQIITRLIRFITACSRESLLSTLQARSNYSLPPGRSRANAERQHAKSLFGLERIVLEITPVAKPDGRPRHGPQGAGWYPHKYRNQGYSKSSTEDMDSENLWAAAENDFSFFSEEAGGEEGEECGIRDDEDGIITKGTSRYPNSDTEEPPISRRTTVTISELDSPDRPAAFQRSRPTPTPLPLRPTHAQAQASNSPIPRTRLSPVSPMHRTPTSSSPSPRRRPPSSQPQPQPQRRPPPASSTSNPNPNPNPNETDVVAALAAFRKAKKTEYETLLRSQQMRIPIRSSTSTTPTTLTPNTTGGSGNGSEAGKARADERSLSPLVSAGRDSSSSGGGGGWEAPVSVEGYWKGEVKIIRNPAPKGRSGFVDMYGNYFERGYLYP